MTAPLVVGLAGTDLSEEERSFLRDVRPLGIILFARNVEGRTQVRRLVDEATEAADCRLALVDQEGGRVQRLRPPLVPRYPAAARIGELFARDSEAGERAAWLAGHLIASDCLALGLNVPCLPVADVASATVTEAIGDRAYAADPDAVATLARAAANGVLAAGGLPVAKHLPGHGRAEVDSHSALPRLDASLAELERDFAPFRALSDLPLAMTAHVTYTAIDPARPATLSPRVVALIREKIGFGGLLMSDDISMGALKGPVETRGREALQAGVDCVLHCNGSMREMARLAEVLDPMTDACRTRLEAAHALLPFDARAAHEAVRAEFLALMGTPA